MIYGDMDDDGFYMGELGARRGLVPSNFLQDAGTGLSDDEAIESVSMITPARSGESIHTPDSRKSLSSDKADKVGGMWLGHMTCMAPVIPPCVWSTW